MLRIHVFLMLLAMSLGGAAQMTFDGRWPSLAELADGSEGPDILVGEEELSAYEAYTEANRLIIEQNWVEAEAILETMMAVDADNRNLAYKRALCLRAIKGRLEEAVPLAMQAIRGEFAKRYNPFDVEMTLPPETALDMALEVLQFSGHYPEAQAVAKTMMDRHPERDFLHQKAKQALADCVFAMGCIADPQRMDIQEEGTLNSGSADYAPVLAPDGESVYFTSYRGQTGAEDKKRGRIFRATRTERGWSPPKEVELGNRGKDMTTVGILGDEETLLVYQSQRNEGAVWKATQDGFGRWAFEEKLGYPIDSRHWETSLTERFDGRERVFVSDRPGGKGGRDLYRTVLLPDGTWSEPLNLGSRINTPGEEESPVLSADGRFLVFSSNGHQGMGGFDLFRCVRLDNGSWSEPEHMGFPLNTPGDEAMVTLDASGQSGYLSSKREGGLDLDIYRVDILGEPEEALAVYLGKVNSWREGDVIEVKSIDEGPAVFRVFRARPGNGDFVAALPPCREYRMSWVRRGKTLESRSEFIPCDAAYGNDREIGRLDPFGKEEKKQVLPREMPNRKPRTESGTGAMKAGTYVAASTEVDVPSSSESTPAPSHSFDHVEEGAGSAEVERDAAGSGDAEPVAAEPTAMAYVEFEAVSATVEFGYGRYLTQTGSAEVQGMVAEILARRAMGEVPVLEIEGSASFVPVKNKRAYESNEQLAKMRAQRARDAIITALSAEGLEVGIDFQIVLDWKVAGPEFKGDAVTGQSTYRNFQYAKFSLGRQLVEKRR
ncbi:MAG: hypothetical protein ACPHCT_05790 [Flavobacteriales bacterium]